MALDVKHLANVRRILEALADEPDLGRQAVALEDAFVAVGLGLTLGLSAEAVRRQSASLITECVSEQTTPSTVQ